MKGRKHHNNKGLRQIQRGKTADQVEDMAKRIFGGDNGKRHKLPRV